MRRNLLNLWLKIFVLGFCVIQVKAQSNNPNIYVDSIVIQATKLPSALRSLPFSTYLLSNQDKKNTGLLISLQEYLNDVPGVFASNANNYAQDLRITMRGFGARSAFGIRGIKLIVDGIPETTPDGQGQIDNLNIGSIKKVEVIRGPASTLYGNASGGVIYLNTVQDFDKNFIEGGLTFGAFNTENYQLNAGIKITKKTDFILAANHFNTNGYRENSSTAVSNVGGHLIHHFNKKATLALQAHYTYSPFALDPGGITKLQADTARVKARDKNVQFKTDERVQQNKFAYTFDYAFSSNSSIKINSFYSNRLFQGKLPFTSSGWIDLYRTYFGGSAQYQLRLKGKSWVNTLQIGYDYLNQSDDRTRYDNLEGVQGDVVLDQNEQFNNQAFYLLDNLQFKSFLISVGLRYDLNNIIIKDQLQDTDDTNGNVDLDGFSPSLGLSFPMTASGTIYTNFRTGFETPSLSEYSSNPNGNDGFNENLVSQRAFNFELGYRHLRNNKFYVDGVVFVILSNNELVSYELEDFPGRNFYRNAGSTTRYGLELGGHRYINSHFRLDGNLGVMSIRYREYIADGVDFSKNRLPGIPNQTAKLSLNYSKKIESNIGARYVGSIYADDANETLISGFFTLDFNIAYQYKKPGYDITPFAGVNNITNTNYFDNIRINAFGNRYYEPAPERNIYIGVRVKLEKRDKKNVLPER